MPVKTHPVATQNDVASFGVRVIARVRGSWTLSSVAPGMLLVVTCLSPGRAQAPNCDPVALPTNLPTFASHVVHREKQETDVWCWAAVTQMIGDSFGKQPGNQCDIVARTMWQQAGIVVACLANLCPCSSTAAACKRSACGITDQLILGVCAQSGPPRLDAACLRATIIPDECLDDGAAMPSWDRLRYELGRRGPLATSKGHPIILWIEPVGGGLDHLVACKGFRRSNSGQRLLYIVDPFPTCLPGAHGEITSITYPTLADQLGDEWTFVRAYVDIRDGLCTDPSGAPPKPTPAGAAGGMLPGAPGSARGPAPSGPHSEVLAAAALLLPNMCEIAGLRGCVAVMGPPIPRVFVRADRLAKFSPGGSPASFLEDGGWLVPVYGTLGIRGGRAHGSPSVSRGVMLGSIVVKRTRSGRIEPLMTMGDEWTQRVVQAVTIASPPGSGTPASLLVIPGLDQQYALLQATPSAHIVLRRIDFTPGYPVVGLEKPAGDVFGGLAASIAAIP